MYGKNISRSKRLTNTIQAYIQDIWKDSAGLMVICFFREQAKILLAQDSFEVDMSFKRLRMKNTNEITFAVWLENHSKGNYS